MKTQPSIRSGLSLLPIRPVYLASVEYRGKRNIISIGMFAYFSGKPTLVGIGIASSRYSYELIRKSKAYVVNVVDEKLIGAVKICGEQSGRDTDKFKAAGLTAVGGSKVDAPLIEESPVNVECRVVQEVKVGNRVWFIGEVLAVHVRASYDWKDGVLLKWIGDEGFYHKVGQKVGEY